MKVKVSYLRRSWQTISRSLSPSLIKIHSFSTKLVLVLRNLVYLLEQYY